MSEATYRVKRDRLTSEINLGNMRPKLLVLYFSLKRNVGFPSAMLHVISRRSVILSFTQKRPPFYRRLCVGREQLWLYCQFSGGSQMQTSNTSAYT